MITKVVRVTVIVEQVRILFRPSGKYDDADVAVRAHCRHFAWLSSSMSFPGSWTFDDPPREIAKNIIDLRALRSWTHHAQYRRNEGLGQEQAKYPWYAHLCPE